MSVDGTADGEGALVLQERVDPYSFTARLEHEARGLRAAPREQDDVVLAGLEREVALALDQLDSLGDLRGRLALSLLRSECQVLTDLHRSDARASPYAIDPEGNYAVQHRRERMMLRGRLLQLDQERRRLALDFEQRQRALWDRLGGLLAKHLQLRP
jgi:hypothetical protein